MPKHITDDTKRAVKDYYLSRPMSEKEVADCFNISIPSIIKILDYYRIKRHTKAQLFSPNLDENFFEVIDNEFKAYFLGLIITDGCIYKKHTKQNLLSITLQEKDKYILEEFANVIHSNKAITSDGRGCYSIQILSNKMVESLEQYGITENKSLHTIFPTNIPLNMYPHLIRGILDGDGSVSFYNRFNRKSHVKAIRFCQGNEQFLKDLVNFLQEKVNIKAINLYQEKENLWSIAYRNNQSLLKLANYLYRGSSIYLIRKKELCDKIVREILHDGNTEVTNISKDILVL